MTTILQTPPAYFCAHIVADSVLRVSCLSIEVHDVPPEEQTDDTGFDILIAKAQQDPMLANALLDLFGVLQDNLAALRKSARS